MTRFTLAASTAIALLSSAAIISPASADRLCEGAVSTAACATHRVYLASSPFYGRERDTSPAYMMVLDPRYNGSLRDAGGGGGSGGSGAGAGGSGGGGAS